MKKILILLFVCVLSLSSCTELIDRMKKDRSKETDGGDTAAQTVTTEDVTDAETACPVYDGDLNITFYGDESGRYAYGTLNAEQKKLYVKIRDAAADFMPYAEITGEDEALYAYQAVFFDYPELFYISEHPSVRSGRLYFEYVFPKDQIKPTSDGLDAAYERFVTGQITDGMTEFEKFLSVYTYLINITKYAFEEYDLYEAGTFDYSVYRVMSAAGPLCDQRSICTGYARATQYLCQRLGIECFTVNGYGNDGDHYFNIVKLGGNWYYSDTTWGDPVGSDTSIDYLTYYFFCTTTEETLRTRRVDSVIPMPECTATEYNYFIYFNLYAETLEEAESILCREYEKGKREITIKVPYSDTGDAIYEALHDGSLYSAMYDRGIDAPAYRIAYSKKSQNILIRF